MIAIKLVKCVFFLQLLVICGVGWATVVQGQSDGRYRPAAIAVAPTAARNRGGGGQNDGRYNPAGDGRYVGSNDGKYVHIAGKDGPGDAGYKGTLIGGGEYSGKNIGGGQYSGGSGQAGSGASGGGSAVGSGGRATGILSLQTAVGIGGRAAATTQRPIVVTKAIPAEGWQIIRNEKSESPEGYHYL